MTLFYFPQYPMIRTTALVTSLVWCLFGAFPVQTEAAIDPLSKGPLPLTEKHVRSAQTAFEHKLIYTDEQCYLKPDQIAPTEIAITALPPDLCANRTQELIYSPSFAGLAACLNGLPQFAMKVSIGTHGIGKTKEGNRKSPVGTYWLGHPRHSLQFGIFIPVGYPNLSNIAAGFTGSAIGIHGPMRFMVCSPTTSLSKNWTAGCFAVGRDTQIIALSEWVIANWPVKLTIRRE